MQNYWNSVLTQRINRRRAIVGTTTVAGAAAFLAACGGDDSGSGGQANKDQSGLIAPQKDIVSEAKAGGTLRTPANTDIRSHEPYLRDASVNFHTWMTYTFLVRSKSTALSFPAPDSVIPDGATSWEYSPDKLTLTFKMQPDNKWDQRAPTNGRQVVAEDVVYSWQKLEKVSSIRAELSNAVSPAGPIMSVTAPDSMTVVMKLAFPQAELLSQLRDYSAATLLLTPREYDSGFDARTDSRGSGPYYRAEYTPSVSSVYVRNKNNWDKTAPYIERIERPIITEYATALAQLRAGGIHYYGDGDVDLVRSEDLVATKRDIPDLQMMPTDVTGLNRYFMWGQAQGSPFRDVRVRRAFMNSLDRDLWIDTFFNSDAFRKQGLPVDSAWNTCVNCNYTGYWLDPKSKDFGDAAKYYKYDVPEAKKLLAAAGHGSGVDIDAPYITTGQYGPTFTREMEVLLGMASESGFRPKSIPVDYNTEWRTKFTDPPTRDQLGKFSGVSAQLASTSSRVWMWALLNSGGSFYRGFDVDGTGSAKGDPALDKMTSALLQEFDQQKALNLSHDIQRREAEMSYAGMFPGGASSFRLGWPAVANFGVYRQDRWFKKVFMDPTKAPNKA